MLIIAILTKYKCKTLGSCEILFSRRSEILMKKLASIILSILTLICIFSLISCVSKAETSFVTFSGGASIASKKSSFKVKNGTFALTDTVTPTCALTFDATTQPGGLAQVVSNSNTCSSQDSCIVCTATASSNTCNISCTGTVHSNVSMDNENINIFLTYTESITGSPDAAGGAISIHGSIDNWPEFAFDSQDSPPIYETNFANCNGTNGHMNIISLDENLDSTSANAFTQVGPILALGDATCSFTYKFKAAMSLNGASTPNAPIVLTRGNVSLIAKICNAANITNCQNPPYLDSSWTANWSDIVGHWKLENVSDSTGNGNTGTVNGTVPFTGTGKVNNAADFSGSNGNYIEIGWATTPSLTTAVTDGGFSVCTWIYPESLTGELGIFGIGNGTDGINLATYDDTVYFWYKGRNIIQGGSLSINTWHHICGVVELGLDISIYLDGSPVVSSGASGGASTYTLGAGNKIIIGNEHEILNGQFFNGLIDDVSLWNRALSASEVASLYEHQNI